MGPLNSRILRSWESGTADPQQPEVQAGPSYVSGSHKRKQSSGPCLGPESENNHSFLENEEDLQQVISTSQGKKVKITSEYAYQTLFLNGETSDIKIRALGKVWCLHKMFLCQLDYFATMFRGSWKESHEGIIDLEIADQNIDAESLHFVLGSLYRGECILMEPLQVPGVLATACLLQVKDVIQQCDKTMKETINAKTVCSYYVAAEAYGLDSVKKGCFEWLLHNLMTHPSVELYKELNIELMNLLISSSNLLVMQKEMDVYTTLKEWMFLHLNPAWKGSMKQLLANANNWFSRYRERVGNIAFLETKEGIVFQSVFKNLRFQHIICDLASTRVIEQDTLIPSEWLSSIYKRQWFTLLRAQQYKEIGPRDINETELEEYSMRCGKRIVKDGKYSWKWSGYNFGFPLHVIFTSHYIIFKQNTFCQPYDDSICLQPLRNIAFRLTLVYFDSSGKLSFSKTTGYKILTFEKDEEQVVMKLDSIALSFPLYIFCNFLFISLENPGN
ncbi:germ cell-less protein-like 2 [Camelus ferus]|uniref:Germ cell-less protein-like 2 n=2 Tax=Camelus TaxID=9836 RepID=S9XB75_CAMFR|nr:germ cell-less protein-like 2 [Camelus ferus]XP_010948282.1 germ cell-less protein-like 2 [Camelus bactrianus]EPY72386.1 GCL (germ cell-less) family member-like protein [Camelus ferus]